MLYRHSPFNACNDRRGYLLLFLLYRIEKHKTRKEKLLTPDCCCSVAKSCPPLWPHGLQHTRPPCPSPSPGVLPSSLPLNWWCHPTISSTVTLFTSFLQSFPASGSFPKSWLLHQVAKVLELGLEASSVWPEAETACKLRSESLGPLVRGCYVDAYRDDWDGRISARCKTSFWAFSTFHLSCESSWCLKIINDLLKGDHLEAAKRKGHPLLRHQDRGVCVCMLSCFLGSTLCNLMNGSLPGSSVHGDSPAKNTGVGCHALH